MTTTAGQSLGNQLRTALADIFARRQAVYSEAVYSTIRGAVEDLKCVVESHSALGMYAEWVRNYDVGMTAETVEIRLERPLVLSKTHEFETHVLVKQDKNSATLECWTNFVQYDAKGDPTRVKGQTHTVALSECDDVDVALNDVFVHQLQLCRETLSASLESLMGAAPANTPTLWVDMAKSKVVPESYRDAVH